MTGERVVSVRRVARAGRIVIGAVGFDMRSPHAVTGPAVMTSLALNDIDDNSIADTVA